MYADRSLDLARAEPLVNGSCIPVAQTEGAKLEIGKDHPRPTGPVVPRGSRLIIIIIKGLGYK